MSDDHAPQVPPGPDDPGSTPPETPAPRLIRGCLQAGDFVAFSAAVPNRRGRVDAIRRRGVVEIDGTPSMSASEQLPIAVIAEFEPHGNGWRPTGKRYLRPVNRCTRMAGLAKPEIPAPHIWSKTADVGELTIYSDISFGIWGMGLTSEMFKGDLEALGAVREINIYMNSPGGDVFEGYAIYNLLARHGAERIRVYVDGLAASIASVIALAADEIIVSEASQIMMHRPLTLTVGDVDAHRASVARLDQTGLQIMAIYARHLGRTVAEMTAMIEDAPEKELWLTGEEAMALGYATEMTQASRRAPADKARAPTRQSMAAALVRPWIRRPPKALAA